MSGDVNDDGVEDHDDDQAVVTGDETVAAAAPDETVAAAAPEEAETDRLTRALHWAQQGTSPEVAQERWMRRLAGQSQQRLEQKLTDEQIDDVAMIAAWVHAEAVVEGARMARRRMMRSAVLRFVGTVIGAAIGAGIMLFVIEAVLR